MPLGDIGAIIDSLEFDATQCDDPDIIHVYGNVFAIVYTGPDYDGWIKTVTIANDGEIDNSVIDSYEFDAGSGQFPSIVRVGDNIFAIAYTGPDSDGWIKTVTIANNGQITEPATDSREFDSGLGTRPHIIHIKNLVYGIVYSDIWNDGILKTYEIGTNGTIGGSALGTYEFATADGKQCKIIKVTNSMVALIFIDSGNDLYLCTVGITGPGGIDAPYEDLLQIASGTIAEQFIVNVSGNVFAIAYRDFENDGWIKTITINDNGQIDDAIIDSYEFETTTCQYPHIEDIGHSMFAVFFTGGGSGAVIKTIEIAANGQITEPFIDSGIIDDTTGDTPGVTHVSGNVYAVVIKGVDADGWLKTISINREAPSKPHTEMMMGMG